MVSTRLEQLVNNNWTFMYGDVMDARVENYDDSHWYTVGIPHSFGTPYFMENDFYVGYGCYRKWLSIDPAWLGKQISLEFQAAFQDAEIYVNGQLAGTHQGGYTAFVVDITPWVRAGNNIVFVRLNNLWNPRLAPRAGEHVFNGGLYRDVSLLITDKVHVAWYGTYVTTPQVSELAAAVDICTELANDGVDEVDITVESQLFYEDASVTKLMSRATIPAGTTLELLQQGAVEQPRLWHPDTPHLYRLVTRVYQEERLTDEYMTTFGVRTIRFDAKEGFFLNGKHLDIIGANVHQDHAGWGDAVTRAGMARDIKMIKDCGMNFIRGSHYPHHPYFAAECDRQGVLFWSELCYWGIGGENIEGYWNSSAYPVRDEDKPDFEASCMMALEEMIRTNRNHPSVIVWSMCNEPFFSDKEVMGEARALTVKLVEASRRLDPARPAAVGGAQREGFDALGDLAGYNGDGAALYVDPGFPSFVSEYGSVIGDRPGAYDPGYTDGVESNPQWRSGKALWCGFHHGSIASNMGSMGMIDYYRLPLNAWYWYRHKLLGIDPPPPARTTGGCTLRLQADKTSILTDGTDDTHIVVELIDCDGARVDEPIRVRLEVAEGGGIFPTGRRIELSPEQGSFLDGQGAIELRSYFAGTIVVCAFAEGVASAELRIEAEGGVRWQGQHLRLPEAPPSRMAAPRSGASVDIGRSRPVFCSSSLADRYAMYATDGVEETSWLPEQGDTGAWIMVDLEGRKDADYAVIVFEEAVSNLPVCEIDWSQDGKDFYALQAQAAPEHKCALRIVLPAEGLRYLRVCFLERPVAIRHIRIFT